MAVVKEDKGDARADAQTRYTLSLGDSFQGAIGPGESDDWVRVELTRGTIYDISITAAEVARFRVIDPRGNDLYTPHEEFSPGRKFIFSPALSGAQYINVSKQEHYDDYPGEYEIFFAENTIPTGTYDDVAGYLLDGSDSGEWARDARYAFDVEPGGVLTAKINDLTEQGQQLARWALEAWSNVIGIRFELVEDGFAHITFDDEAGTAFVVTDTTDDGVIVSAGVVVPKVWITPEDWLPEHGARMDDHFFWTFIHEIGHALGLIHPGPYQGAAAWGVDNAFLIDSYQATVMTYFDQVNNTWINASYAFPVTPMIADIIAMQNLYGAPADINAGDTVYGYRSNVEGYLGEFFALWTGEANPFVSFNAGSHSTPAFADLDGDGDPDLVVGNGNGGLHYFENTGTVANPGFTERNGAANPLDRVDAGSHSTPAFADLDGDGDADLVIGDGNGDLHYFENTGTVASPGFTERNGSANPLEEVDEFNFSALVFADLDADGDLDLVMAIRDRTIDYYENTGTTSGPDFTERSGADNPLGGVVIGYANAPAFADLDGDDDLDLIVGNGDNGGILYYENTGTRSEPDFTATGFGLPTTLTLYDSSGRDTLDLRTDTADQRVDLRPEGISNVYGSVGNLVIARDTLIENFVAGSGNDLVIGNAAANRLDGREGNDILNGGKGADSLDGGDGLDTASYADSPGRVVVRLHNTSAAKYGDAEGDTLTGIENLVGSGHNDVLAGDGGDNRLEGGDGNDDLFGGPAGGDDVMLGGNGDDRIYGGKGNDTLTSGHGHDLLKGGLGEDVLIADGDDMNVLNGGSGRDTFRFFPSNLGGGSIQDFTDGEDVIDLTAFTGVESMNDLDIESYGDNVRIELSGTGYLTTIILSDFDMSSLDNSDFLFAV